MSYFYTQSHVELQPYRGIGQKREQPSGGVVNDRDQRIADEVNKLNAQPSKFADLNDPSKCKPGPTGPKSMIAPGFTGDNVLVDPPKPKQLPRVRQPASDASLRKIWSEDHTKERVQNLMTNAGDFVQKMTEHGTSPLSPHVAAHVKGMKHVEQEASGDAPAVCPAGFKGMGVRSNVVPLHGRRAPTSADFAVPSYEPKRRDHGVKMSSRPPDTLTIG